jgi:hypothetical protein
MKVKRYSGSVHFSGDAISWRVAFAFEQSLGIATAAFDMMSNKFDVR